MKSHVDQKKIRNIFPAIQDDVQNLRTLRPLPTQYIQMIDPFLFLNHHGPQIYPPENEGLPFGPHPHRGFQTVTFILEGDVAHRDSAGFESVIRAGGVQWMSAGRGVVHEEVSSQSFREKGGPLEILQLWINLPKRLKFSDPAYRGFQRDEIPVVEVDEGRVNVSCIAGEWQGLTGPLTSPMDFGIFTLEFRLGGKCEIRIPENRSIFFYVVRGKIEVNGGIVDINQLVEFEKEGSLLHIRAREDSYLLLCHAEPLRETVAWGGPFVMNTREEVFQAYEDYRLGKLR